MFPTRYGKIVDYNNPTSEMIDVKDIAYSLSKICRFNGHSRHFYSVAQHSTIVARSFTDPVDRLYVLLHDGHEAYTGDLTSPFKRYLETTEPGIVKTVETKLDAAIHAYFGLAYPLSQHIIIRVKHADKQALATEIRDLTKTAHEHALKVVETLPEPFDEEIKPLNPRQAHKVFFAALRDTQEEIAKRNKRPRGVYRNFHLSKDNV